MKQAGFREEQKDGFSLVELMLVMALFGILSALSISGFLRSAPERHLRNAARNLYADLQRARLLAVNKNKKISVRFNEAGNAYYIDEDAEGEEGYKVCNASELKRSLADYGGVEYGKGAAVKNWNNTDINRVVPNHNVISFKATGTASSASVYLQHVNRDAVTYAVTTTNFGAVKVRSFNGSTWE
ncbi:MAG: GspH/FimT family pseudopilin [Candidatus Electrothrix aestuarii]|uniref:Type II secretion system protein H n=1 Tax=Candidatus Electrothrix aestuarii TaxID=3062594 RepID=A0AAU8LS91_9BACT|nr:GspH/FimT family pseudopilin [Candidatus Electrothrix aestuarii]